MLFRSLPVWSLVVAVFLPSTARAAFGSASVSVVPDRAIVLYASELYVLDAGTRVLIEYMRSKRDAKILGKLPESVREVTNLGGGEIPGGGKRIYLITSLKVDNRRTLSYLEPTKDNRITLVEGKRDDHANWRNRLVQTRHMTPDRADYEWNIHIIATAGAESDKGRFITVSNEKKLIKDRQGNPLTIYPLVLGKESDAAKFQLIEFSGK